MHRHVRYALVWLAVCTVSLVAGCGALMPSSDGDASLREELEGTIVFQSNRADWTHALYSLDLASMDVSRLSPRDEFLDQDPVAVGDEIYSLVGLMSHQVGKFDREAIEGVYVTSLSDGSRKRVSLPSGLDAGCFGVLGDKRFVLDVELPGERTLDADLLVFDGVSARKVFEFRGKTLGTAGFLECCQGTKALVSDDSGDDPPQSHVLIDVDTGEQRPILDAHLRAIDPEISPDGTKIAFISGQDSDLYTCDIDGLNPKRLTKDKRPKTDPAWSPDGKYIVYSVVTKGRSPFSNHTLHVITADGTRQTQLTEWGGEGVQDIRATWTYATR